MKQFTSKTQKIGEIGEDETVVFLMKQGYDIVERNIANKYGEIDIVAKKSGIYHFFEVKTGYQGSWFNPAENLTEAKIRKLRISVDHYCFMRNIEKYEIAGVIVLLPVVSGAKPLIEVFSLVY